MKRATCSFSKRFSCTNGKKMHERDRWSRWSREWAVDWEGGGARRRSGLKLLIRVSGPSTQYIHFQLYQFPFVPVENQHFPLRCLIQTENLYIFICMESGPQMSESSGLRVLCSIRREWPFWFALEQATSRVALFAEPAEPGDRESQ